MPADPTWAKVDGRLDEPGGEERMFFEEPEWRTIEAATARIIPTDRDPGAREAGVVRFIDRYLSGTDYIYAAADGGGFLRMEGPVAAAWEEHVARLQTVYREGVRDLDRRSQERHGADFADLDEDRQDEILVELSGAPLPAPIEQLGVSGPGYGGFALQNDAGLDFFPALCLHTRQGFYSDPVYGGNRDRVGWAVVGFPGPESLQATRDCTYSVEHLLESDYVWPVLIPYVRGRTE
ncbi:MAG: gluconate 2-dehydrogenase subunit 3 family protein [Acidimicrobiia bacterium]